MSRFKRSGDRMLLIGPDGTVLDSRPIDPPSYPTFALKKRATQVSDPARRRARLMARQDGLCFYCSREIEEYTDDPSRFATIDEVTPRHAGGIRDYSNQVAACYACNNSKGGRMPTADELARLAALSKIDRAPDGAILRIIDEIDEMDD